MWRRAGWRQRCWPRRALPIAGFDFDAQLVDRILQFQKSDVGLQGDDQFGAKFEQVFRTESLPLGAVESFDMRPFQPNHVEREGQILAREFGMLRQPVFEPRTEVSQGKRLRGAIGQIGLREPLKGPIAEHRAQARGNPR